MSRSVLCTLSLALSVCATALAQLEPQPEPGQLGLSVTGRGFVSGEAPVKRGDTPYDHVGFSGYELAVGQAIRVCNGGLLRAGVEQQTTYIDQSRNAGDVVVPLPESLKAASLSVGYTQKIDPRWMVSGRVSAGSYVAGSGLLSEGWGANLSAVAIYQSSPELTMMFGLAYNSLMSDLRVLPVFGLVWRPAPQWSVSAGFPKTAVTYHFSRELSLGLAVTGAGGAFKMKDELSPGAAGYSLRGSRLEQRELRVGLDAVWRISSALRLSAMVGEVVYRKFEYIDRDFELRQHRPAPFVSASATVSF